MAEPLKDVRLCLESDVHTALRAVASAHGLGVAAYVERLVVAELEREVHTARMIARATERCGFGRIEPEAAGGRR